MPNERQTLEVEKGKHNGEGFPSTYGPDRSQPDDKIFPEFGKREHVGSQPVDRQLTRSLPACPHPGHHLANLGSTITKYQNLSGFGTLRLRKGLELNLSHHRQDTSEGAEIWRQERLRNGVC